MSGNAAHRACNSPARPDGPWDYRFGAPNRRFPLPDGDPGIARTIQMMTGLARGSEGANHPTIRQKAVEVVRGFNSRDKQGQINAILDWVKKNVDFRGEYKELLQTPVVTIQIRGGDCDDQSMLIAALLKTRWDFRRASTPWPRIRPTRNNSRMCFMRCWIRRRAAVDRARFHGEEFIPRLEASERVSRKRLGAR